MNQTGYETQEQHETESASAWPTIRLSLHGAAAVIAVLAFAFLVVALRGSTETSNTAWLLLGLILVVLAGQVVMMILGRDREAALEDETTEGAWGDSSESTWAGDAYSNEAESWGETATTTEQTAWEEPATEEAAPANDLVTIGCPSCEGTFSMSEADVADGTFHCPKCGVAGYLGE